jgi:hypothetical protein
MDFESAEDSGSLLQIVQVKLVRQARYGAPIAEGKGKEAGFGFHLEIYDISFAGPRATGSLNKLFRQVYPRSRSATPRPHLSDRQVDLGLEIPT